VNICLFWVEVFVEGRSYYAVAVYCYAEMFSDFVNISIISELMD
jgi:hypothetical protein